MLKKLKKYLLRKKIIEERSTTLLKKFGYNLENVQILDEIMLFSPEMNVCYKINENNIEKAYEQDGVGTWNDYEIYFKIKSRKRPEIEDWKIGEVPDSKSIYPIFIKTDKQKWYQIKEVLDKIKN